MNHIIFYPLTITEKPTEWHLVHPDTADVRTLLNHPAWQPLYLKLLQVGYVDTNENEFNDIGNERTE